MTYTTEQIREMLGKITQGEWEQCIIESTGEYGVHVANDPDIKKLPDGTISNGLVVCKSMTGPNKINNSLFIASAPTIIRELLERNEALEKVASVAEMLWVTLANVSGGDWSKQTKEWREAAAKWRDRYYVALKQIEPTAHNKGE